MTPIAAHFYATNSGSESWQHPETEQVVVYLSNGFTLQNLDFLWERRKRCKRLNDNGLKKDYDGEQQYGTVL